MVMSLPQRCISVGETSKTDKNGKRKHDEAPANAPVVWRLHQLSGEPRKQVDTDI